MTYITAPTFASLASSNEMDQSTNFAQDALAVAVGSVVDFGTSLYNSVNIGNVFGEDISTYDTLQSMGLNAMATGYLEHKGLINTISFVGGMFIPGMAGFKLSKIARMGLKGTNLLSPTRVTTSYAKLAELTTQGKKATTAYRSLSNKARFTAVAQGMVDNAAAELAIVATMNAHPMMEDYMDDFGANFATSLLIGSAIGGVIDVASTGYNIKKAVGAAETEAFQSTLSGVRPRSLVTDGVVNFQEAQASIKEMDKLLASPSATPLVKQQAQAFKDLLVTKADEDLTSAFKGKLTDSFKASTENADFYRKLLADEKFLGVGEISYYSPKAGAKTAVGRTVQRITDLIQPSKAGADELSVDAVYIPRENIVVSKTEAPRFATAADIVDEAQLEAMSKRASIYSLEDIGLEIRQAMPADLEVMYLSELKAMDKINFNLPMAVHESNLPRLHALKAKATKLMVDARVLEAQLPELEAAIAEGGQAAKKAFDKAKAAKAALDKQLGNFKLRIVSDTDSLFSTQVLNKKFQQTSGIKPTHLQDLDSISATAKRMDLWEGLSIQSRTAISEWVKGHGGERTIRKAVAEYRRSPETAPSWVREFMEHPERQAQLNELRKHSDSEGYIYLRRGQSARANGHHEVESFTTKPSISKYFAQRTEHDYAYKVHVDDVIGYIHGMNEAEWLVMSPTREYAKDTSRFTRFITNEADNTLATSVPTIGINDIAKYSDDATAQAARQLAAIDQYAPEEIARRLNVENESLEKMLTNGGEPVDGLKFRYSKVEDIPKYLNPTNKALQLSDNGRLGTYGQYINMLKQNADNALLDKWNTETTINLLQTSDSDVVTGLVREMGLDLTNASGVNEFYNMYDVLKKSLSMINDSYAGNRLIQSSDMYSRMMGNAGLVINAIGERYTRVANAANDKLIGPANAALSNIARDEAQLLTHNVFVQAVRSTGNRIKLTDDFRLVEVVGTTKSATGELIENLKPVVFQGQEVAIPEHMSDLRTLLRQYQNVGEELQRMRTTIADITGAARPSNKGLWIPNYDPRSKFVGFIRTYEETPNGMAQVNRIVTGKTIEELNDKRAILTERYADQRVDFIWPSERNLRQSVDYDKLKTEALRGKMQLADLGEAKKGFAAEELPATTLEEARNILHGYSSSIYAHSRDIQGLLMNDIVNQLDMMRGFNQLAIKDQAMTKLSKYLQSGVDSASVMKATLLGSKDLLDSYTPVKALNDGFSNIVDSGISLLNKARNTVVSELPGREAKIGEKWARIQGQLESAGVPYPYAGLEAGTIERGFATEAASGDARRLVSVGNAFASTMALRFMELAHPLINMLSMPILTNSAIGGSLENVLGNTAKIKHGAGMFSTTKHMSQGVKLVFNPPTTMKGLISRAEDNGIFKPIVSEATNVIKMTRLREKGLIAQAEKLVEKIDNSLAVTAKDGTKHSLLTGASDWSETMVRRTAFGTGVSVAVERYGLKLGLDDDKIFLFARDFVDRSVGNYAAHQRPVMFHGTLGAAAGLFQTYMLTMAQNIYRNLETRDIRTIAGVAGWQGSIFGLSSLPGYDTLSQYIGENVTTDHTDITTGLYKNLNEGMADILVYGLPSNVGSLWGDSEVGPQLSTRGSIDGPRWTIPAAQMVADTGIAMASIAERMAATGDTDAVSGFLEAMSIQSVSRPIARIAEIANGYSITSQGRTVSTPNEVWTPMGIASRLMGTRTTEEWKLRSAVHLNTYYGSLDRDNRQVAINEIRTMVRNGGLTDEGITRAFDSYLENGGSPQGFRSAINNALEFEQQSMRMRLFDDLKPDSPILHMIDTM